MGYTVGGVTYSFNSIKNQKIKDALVNREVLCCMTQEVEYILRQSIEGNIEDIPFTEEDIENRYIQKCDECGETTGSFEEIFPDELEDEEIGTIGSAEDRNLECLCPVCQLSYSNIQEAKNCCANETIYRCSNCGKIYCESDYEDLSDEAQEIFEWWAVTNWLGDKLFARGESVIKSYGKSYWGRRCCGQAVSSDGVINDIANDMEILEGQKYSWDENS